MEKSPSPLETLTNAILELVQEVKANTSTSKIRDEETRQLVARAVDNVQAVVETFGQQAHLNAKEARDAAEKSRQAAERGEAAGREATQETRTLVAENIGKHWQVVIAHTFLKAPRIIQVLILTTILAGLFLWGHQTGGGKWFNNKQTEMKK